MVTKTKQDLKREKKRQKRQKIDNITNSYMINFAWGIFIIILLRFVETGYSSVGTILKMPIIMKSFAAVFAIGAIGLLVCGKLNIKNKKDKFYNYFWFLIVMAAGSLCIGYYTNIRNLFLNLSPALSTLDSRWWISRGFIVAIAAYLVITLIITAVKVALIEKK
ncbi:MAG: hypothetical protein IJV86_01390 [Clostridia bacterium]|nr:hypothetical protein [Clostridia bacterium]